MRRQSRRRQSVSTGLYVHSLLDLFLLHVRIDKGRLPVHLLLSSFHISSHCIHHRVERHRILLLLARSASHCGNIDSRLCDASGRLD